MSLEENKKPPRRRRWLLWLALSVAVVLTAAALIHVFTRDTALERLKRQIRSEVPVGSTREQVEAWAKENLSGQLPGVVDPPPDAAAAPTWLELAGVPPERRGTVLHIVMPCGRYTVRGKVEQNEMSAFFTLNAQGEVTGHYFLTLEELAAMGR